MKKMPRLTLRPAFAGFLLWHGFPRINMARARRGLVAGFSLLVALLIVLVWINLARQIHPGARSVPSAAFSAPRQVTPPRRDGSLVYDPLQHIVLLFGGTLLTSEAVQTNETWAWNGQSWQQLHPVTSPPALQSTMVYDAASQRVLLFLTQIQNGDKIANEMWTWDGHNWQQVQSTSVPGVLDAGMAYDPESQQILLFGGEIPRGQTATLTNATWTWNGTIWQALHPATAPSPRAGVALTYDAARKQMVLYGGTTQQGLSTETWTWNGTTWQLHSTIHSPSARQNALLIYDSATQQTLLFGGINPAGTQPAPGATWIWNGLDWSKISTARAPTDLYESAAYDDATQTVTVYAVLGFISKTGSPGSSAPASQTWTWNGTLWKLLS